MVLVKFLIHKRLYDLFVRSYLFIANIDLQTVLREMPDDPALWRINSQDRYSSKESKLRGRYYSPR